MLPDEELHTPFVLGKFEGFVLNDYSGSHKADELIVNPNLEELEQYTQEFAFKLNEVPMDYNNLLIKTGDQNVLVDSGIPMLTGKLCLGLDALKIDPADFDMIVITHSDRDHIGGILDQEGKISFPNARYIMLDDAWQFWSSEERRAELTRLNKLSEEKT